MTFCPNLISATCATFSASMRQRNKMKCFSCGTFHALLPKPPSCVSFTFSPMTALILSVSASFSTTFCVCCEISSFVFSLSLQKETQHLNITSYIHPPQCFHLNDLFSGLCGHYVHIPWVPQKSNYYF